MFHMAVGIYKHRVRESYNLIYWINTIVFLPAKTLQYFGVSEGSWIGKAANVVAWLATVLGFIFSLPDFKTLQSDFSAWLAGLTGVLKQ